MATEHAVTSSARDQGARGPDFSPPRLEDHVSEPAVGGASCNPACVQLGHQAGGAEFGNVQRGEHVQCLHCQKEFNDRVMLSMHMAKAHNVRNPVRRYLRDTTCIACGLLLHTRQRIFRHVAFSSPKCFQMYEAYVEPLTVAESLALDEEAARMKLRDKEVHKPAIRIDALAKLCGESRQARQ